LLLSHAASEDLQATFAAWMLQSSPPNPSGSICPNLPQVTPLADANKAEPSASVVRSVEFHPNGQLLLTAGLDKRLRLFQVRPVLPGNQGAVSNPLHPYPRCVSASSNRDYVLA
jgi:WD40 repeat protein